MTIYIVSGVGARCGSTMVMKALGKGGMKLAYDKSTRQNDMEFSLSVQWSAGFPHVDQFDGHVVKIFPPPWGGLLKIPGADPQTYKILWIDRPAEERWESFLKLQNRLWKFKNLTEMHQEIKKSNMDFDYFDDRAREALGIMQRRMDVADITIMDYSDIVNEPLEMFDYLADHGWPVTPLLAAAVPKKSITGTGQMAGGEGDFSVAELATAQDLKKNRIT